MKLFTSNTLQFNESSDNNPQQINMQSKCRQKEEIFNVPQSQDLVYESCLQVYGI